MTDSSELQSELIDAFNRRNWNLAKELASTVLSLTPQSASAHFIAGIALFELRALAPALDHLQQASGLEPNNSNFLAQYSRMLSIARATSEALVAADQVMALAPTDPLILDTIGVVYTQANAHERAAAAFEAAVNLSPDSAHYRFNLATSLIYMGDVGGAELQLEACLRLDPHYWKAHLTLSQLKTQAPSSHHLERLRMLLRQGKIDTSASTYLHLALAKELEDLGSYSESFKHLVQGKTAAGSMRHYSIERDEALFDAITRAFPCSQEFQSGYSTEQAIFIIGMPRSGTTLIERIISSHPDVYSAGELQNFGVALKRASGSRTPLLLDPDTIERSSRLDWEQLGRAYISSTQPLTRFRRIFIDKLPHNFLYAGFIANALPNAKMICLRRNALDTCLSNFRQLFALSSPYYDYSFDLMDTGRYFIMFDRLMAHWRRVLPGRILELEYENIVHDKESIARQLLSHCELSWNDACLDFEKNAAPVSTASAIQVRSPIYRSAMGRWRHYREELSSLKALLVEAGIDAQD